MTASTNTVLRLTMILGLVGVALAITVPAAVAGHQDLGAKGALQQIQGVHPTKGAGSAAATVPDWFERAVARQATAVEAPDWFERAVARQVASQRTRLDAASRTDLPGGGVASVGLDERTFSWQDAGLGACVALLIVAALGLVVSRTRTARRRLVPR